MTDVSPFSQNQREPGVTGDERIPVFLMANTLETGGSERQFVTMAHALDGDRFSLSLGCIKRCGPFVKEVENVIEFSAGGNLFGPASWKTRLRLAGFLKEKKIRVAHAFDFYSNLMLIPAARWAGVPVVLGSHRQLGDLLSPAKFRTQRQAFRFCDRVVCNSGAAADTLRAVGIVESKIAVIPNGLPETFFAETVPALPEDPNALRVGMISRMNDPIKRHDLFLRVAAKLAPKCPQAQFVLIGDGPLRAGLENLCQELGLTDRVTFLGDRADVPAVLASLDISVLPSASESLPNAILESMAAGVAVVAANVGGNPELIEHERTGLLFPMGDEDKFASALERLATQAGLRKQLGTAGRQRARERYSIAIVKQRFQDLYQQLLSQKVRTEFVRPEPMATVKSTHEGLSR